MEVSGYIGYMLVKLGLLALVAFVMGAMGLLDPDQSEPPKHEDLKLPP